MFSFGVRDQGLLWASLASSSTGPRDTKMRVGEDGGGAEREGSDLTLTRTSCGGVLAWGEVVRGPVQLSWSKGEMVKDGGVEGSIVAAGEVGEGWGWES